MSLANRGLNQRVMDVVRPLAPMLPVWVSRLWERWRRGDTSLGPAARAFIAHNRSGWEPAAVRPGRGRVLIEGYLASSGPNYLLRTGVIAKAVEAELDLEPIVVFKAASGLSHGVIELYRSFAIERFVSDRSCQPTLRERVRELRRAYETFRALRSPEAMLALEHEGVRYGDLVYDTIIHDSTGTLTIDRLALRELLYILQAQALISDFLALLDQNDVRLYVATHSQYLPYGLLVRCCCARDIPVIETTDMYVWMYDAADGAAPKFHTKLRRQIEAAMRAYPAATAVAETDRMLEERFAARLDQSDVKLAYGGKRTYDTAALRAALRIDNDRPIAFIFAHVFSDAPQGLSDGMLFRDYYSWLEHTLKVAAAIRDVNWVVKPHPANTLYREEGLVDGIVARLGGGLFLCPSDFSPASVPGIARAIITAQGTAGLEFACLGVPVVLAGRPFYSGFDFTIEPGSVDAYDRALRGVSNLERLDEERQRTAKQVFAAFMRLQQADTSLIDTQLLHTVWGKDGVPGSPERAYELLNGRLAGTDLRQSALFQEARAMVRGLRPPASR